MSRAAGDDEDGETEVDRAKLEVGPTADKVDQGDRDRVVGEGDQGVGDDVEPDDAGLPHVAHAVRHEAVARKNAVQKIHVNPLPQRL